MRVRVWVGGGTAQRGGGEKVLVATTCSRTERDLEGLADVEGLLEGDTRLELDPLGDTLPLALAVRLLDSDRDPVVLRLLVGVRVGSWVWVEVLLLTSPASSTDMLSETAPMMTGLVVTARLRTPVGSPPTANRMKFLRGVSWAMLRLPVLKSRVNWRGVVVGGGRSGQPQA